MIKKRNVKGEALASPLRDPNKMKIVGALGMNKDRNELLVVLF